MNFDPVKTRAMMAEQRLTRRELARAVGLSYHYVVKILQGVAKPGADAARRISHYVESNSVTN